MIRNCEHLKARSGSSSVSDAAGPKMTFKNKTERDACAAFESFIKKHNTPQETYEHIRVETEEEKQGVETEEVKEGVETEEEKEEKR